MRNENFNFTSLVLPCLVTEEGRIPSRAETEQLAWISSEAKVERVRTERSDRTIVNLCSWWCCFAFSIAVVVVVHTVTTRRLLVFAQMWCEKRRREKKIHVQIGKRREMSNVECPRIVKMKFYLLPSSITRSPLTQFRLPELFRSDAEQESTARWCWI